jgi:RsiW-degrading membrane proteinase PrsW (M82 family)
MSMRARKPVLPELITHFLLGVALGLGFVLLLTLIDIFHVRDLVTDSDAPLQTMTILIGRFALMFGIGAAITGLVLTLEEES